MTDPRMELKEDIHKQFERAASYVSGGLLEPSVSDQLYFYARYKQSTEGICQAPKPGLLDLRGKKKWEAWKGLGELSKEASMKQYITKLAEIDPSWELSASTKLGWVSVSTMMKEEPMKDSDKSVFDFVQENNIEKIKTFPIEELNKLDENEMTLLHWACDRGYVEMVRHLLNITPHYLNTQDIEGQTPLHYAVSCSHEAVIQILLDSKADVNIRDNDGLLPVDWAQGEAIHYLIQKCNK